LWFCSKRNLILLKKKLKYLVLVLVIGFVGIQFIPSDLNQSKIVPKEDIIKFYKPQEEIISLLKNSCYDCHSNNTVYPWYSKLQPISWLLESHIAEAKDELNFNEFNAYSKRKQKAKLKSIMSQLEDDVMPLKSYVLMHSNAKLTDNDKAIIIAWIEKLRDSL